MELGSPLFGGLSSLGQRSICTKKNQLIHFSCPLYIGSTVGMT